MEQEENQNKETSNSISEAIKELNRTLTKNEKDNERVLYENEKKRDAILKKQTDIHSRQLKILFITAFLFILFLFISAIYIKLLVMEIRETQKLNSNETRHQEKVKVTIDIFKDMWLWYYQAKSDSIFKMFSDGSYHKYMDTIKIKSIGPFDPKKDPIACFKDTVIRDSTAIMGNLNVNRFYNYFEILKSLDNADLIDNQTAENILPFFENVGVTFNYIEIKRIKFHLKKCGDLRMCPACNCGSLLDGYEYVFNKFLHKQVPLTKTHCIKDDN